MCDTLFIAKPGQEQQLQEEIARVAWDGGIFPSIGIGHRTVPNFADLTGTETVTLTFTGDCPIAINFAGDAVFGHKPNLDQRLARLSLRLQSWNSLGHGVVERRPFRKRLFIYVQGGIDYMTFLVRTRMARVECDDIKWINPSHGERLFGLRGEFHAIHGFAQDELHAVEILNKVRSWNGVENAMAFLEI